MKILNKIMAWATLVFVLTMTGCLKDSDYSDNKYGTKNTQNQNLVEVHLTSSNSSNFVSRAFDNMDRDTTITKSIPINLTSGPASSDVTVTFKILDPSSSAVVDSLVTIEGWAVPDPTLFKVLNADNKVTIPAGSSTGYISVKFKPSDLLGKTYIFAIQITAISDPKYIISNLDAGYVKLLVKNQWDGDYRCVGYRKHPSLGILAVDKTETLNTVDGTTVKKSGFGDYGSYDMTIKITTDIINVAGTDCYKCIVHVIDPSTGLPAAGENMYNTFTGDATADPKPLTNDVNYYNPVTKTFVLNAFYNAGAPRIAYEVLTRL